MLERFLSLLLVVLLAGCATPPGAAPTLSEWPALQANAGEQVLQLDTAASTFRIFVFRAGKAARLGHNHVLSAPASRSQILLSGGLDTARFQLDFRLDQLQLDDPAARAALGGGFAKALSPEDIAATRLNMLGERNLQAAQHPLLRVRSLRVVGEAPRLAALVEIELHGQRRQQWVALQVPDSIRASGALVLRQSEFGIEPFSVLGGLMAVADELVVEFELKLIRPSAAAAARD